jgi:response regulator of citrate/malate metabolism
MMTQEQMLAELQEIMAAANDREGFYTTAELAAACGVSKRTIHGWLHVAKANGRLEHREFIGESLRGRRAQFAGYRILPG